MAKGVRRVAGSRWAALWLLLLPAWVPVPQTPADPAPGTVPPDTVPRFDTETKTTHRRVTWDDFQAKTSRFEAEQAQIVTAIESDPFDVKVTLINKGYWVAMPLRMSFYAAMDKRQSGVGKGARTHLLLAHEQGHFDLTEIVARRLSGGLGGVEGQGADAVEARAAVFGKIQLAYDRAVGELEELQARYDRETRHGQSARGQRDWNEDIARMLRTSSPGPPLAGRGAGARAGRPARLPGTDAGSS